MGATFAFGVDTGWLIAIGTFIAIVSGAVATMVTKMLPALTEAKEKRLRANLEHAKGKDSLKREMYDYAADQFRDILARAETDAKRRDAIITGQDVRISNLESQVRSVSKEAANCAIREERLISRVALLEARSESDRAMFVASGVSIRTDAVVVTNSLGIISEWPPAATAIFHYHSAEVIGKNVTVIIPPEYVAAHRAAIADVVASGRAVRRGPFRFHARTKDGHTIPIEAVLSQWSDGGERYFAASIRQVTEWDEPKTETPDSKETDSGHPII